MIIFKGFNLDDSIIFDKEVDISWNCSDTKKIFCCNFLGNIPSVKNIKNGNIEFYTFTDMWTSDLVIDISNSVINTNGMNIIEDFLLTVKERFFNTKEYNSFLNKYSEIRSYLYFRFRNNWDQNITDLFNICDNSDRTYNANFICANILERMIISVRERFNSINLNKIVELPFIKGDYLYVIYTLSYSDITVRYKININLI